MFKQITRNYSLLVKNVSKTSKMLNGCVQDYIVNNEWFCLLENEFKKDYFIEINKKLNEEYAKKVIYPKKEDVFRALNLTSLSQVS